jgi:CRP/FNR family cyclic AMP-dependent transcriptional regulator
MGKELARKTSAGDENAMTARVTLRSSRAPIRAPANGKKALVDTERRPPLSPERSKMPPIERDEMLEELRRSSWFRGLPPEVMAQIASIASLKRYAENELVHSKYEEATRLYCVVSGGIRASSMSSDGQESVFAFMGVGSWFGLGAMLDGQTRAHDIRACQETILATIGRRQFNLLLETYPILYKHLALQLCEVVRSAFSVIEDEALLRVQARFAKRLVALADTYGVPHEKGTLIQLHLPQQDLASILHVTRATINKKLVEWQRLRWIDMHYGQIIVMNRAALEQLYIEH